MGLDMTIYKKVRENTRAELLDKLEGNPEVVGLISWRKFYELEEAIGHILGVCIENCKEYELNANDIKRIIDWLQLYDDNDYLNISEDVINLNKILDETDFDIYKLVYESWW